jgi:hypothetical protein
MLDSMRRAIATCIVGVLLASAAGVRAQDSPFARFRTLSPPDCLDASGMVVEYDDAPFNRTFVRVQHMGDPGTVELAQQVANTVTWDVGAMTGLTLPGGSQRGYVDLPGRNAFQAACSGAGFYIDTATFAHTAPLVGEGPNVSVGRDFAPSIPVFRGGASLVVEADVCVPTVRPHAPPVVEGTAQVSLFLYLQDTTSGTVVTQLVGLMDDRVAGTNGSGVEGFGDDGFNAFVSSPLAWLDATGAPVRFVTVGPASKTMQFVDGWVEMRHFSALITPGNFAAALARLRERGLRLSGEPSDYVVLSFGLNGEVIAGTGHANEVALGASVSGLALREMPPIVLPAPRPAIAW